MQILHKSQDTGALVIKPENLDDLWELSHILEENDEVSAYTERKVSLGAERSKQVRKPMRLQGTIKDVELQGDLLRIQIIITQGPDEWVSNGDHHSLTITPHSEFTIHTELDSLRKSQLTQSTKHTPHNILLVTFDREEAWIAQLTRRGYDVIQTLKGDVSKKQPGGGSEDFYQTVADAITDLDERMKLNSIIAASPAFWTEYLIEKLPEQIKKKTTTATCSAVGEASLKEVLARDEVKQVLAADQTTTEQHMVNDVLEAIAKDNACYGMQECKQQAQNARIDTLVVTHSYIDKTREEGTYQELDAILQQVKSTQGTVHLLTHVNEQIDAIGGVAGTLRW